jgi:large subunit ribosomal protein L17
MRHRNKKAILNRPADQRRALIRNLLSALFEYGRIQTTEKKAKVLVAETDKLLSLAKSQKESFHTIRKLNQILFTKRAAKNAFDYIQKTQKNSGFTRITKINIREGDGAVMSQVELIQEK